MRTGQQVSDNFCGLRNDTGHRCAIWKMTQSWLGVLSGKRHTAGRLCCLGDDRQLACSKRSVIIIHETADVLARKRRGAPCTSSAAVTLARLHRHLSPPPTAPLLPPSFSYLRIFSSPSLSLASFPSSLRFSAHRHFDEVSSFLSFPLFSFQFMTYYRLLIFTTKVG